MILILRVLQSCAVVGGTKGVGDSLSGTLLCKMWSEFRESCVVILGIRLKYFKVGVSDLSPLLFVVFMDRISSHSQVWIMEV